MTDTIDDVEDSAVPHAVCDTLREIDAGGTIDMYDREGIIRIAAGRGDGAAPWLAANRHLYFRALRTVRATEEREEMLAA